MDHDKKLNTFIEETRARQRNIVFPDLVRNGRSLDEFFWKGSPHPSLIQRLAAWMIGSALTALGIQIFIIAASVSSFGDIFVGVSVSALSLFLGITTFRNGFARSIKPAQKRSLTSN